MQNPFQPPSQAVAAAAIPESVGQEFYRLALLQRILLCTTLATALAGGYVKVAQPVPAALAGLAWLMTDALAAQSFIAVKVAHGWKRAALIAAGCLLPLIAIVSGVYASRCVARALATAGIRSGFFGPNLRELKRSARGHAESPRTPDRAISSTLSRGAARLVVAYLFASGAFFADSMLVGRTTATTTLGGVSGAAASAGLQAGDTIVRIDAAPIHDWDDVPRAIRGKRTPVTITFRRGVAEQSVTVQPNAEGRVGLVSGMRNEKPPFARAVSDALVLPPRILLSFLGPSSGLAKVQVMGFGDSVATFHSLVLLGFVITMVLPAFVFAALFEAWLRPPPRTESV
jgi:membrane-associated protease RseP (regulator of RpoE activity)